MILKTLFSKPRYNPEFTPYREHLRSLVNNPYLEDKQVISTLGDILFPLDYDKAFSEAQSFLRPGIVLSSHTNFDCEPLNSFPIPHLRRQQPILFVFTYQRIWIDAPFGPGAPPTVLTGTGHLQLISHLDLCISDFFSFYPEVGKSLAGHKHLKPHAYLKAIKLANLLYDIREHGKHSEWFS